MNIFTDQSQFMTLAGQSIEGLDVVQCSKYTTHVQEEAAELAAAAGGCVEDEVEVIDALVDTIVVSAGALISLIGVDGANRAWKAVLTANFRKVLGSPDQTVMEWEDPEAGICYRKDGQIGKPPGWVSPRADLEKIAQDVGLIE
jgi:predicted HAD superfamily Cof-like phosphohydrolase